MKSKADIQENFQDILLVDEEGKIEYFKIKAPDYFDLYPEDLIGKKIPQLYSNLDEETSTLMRAIKYGEEKLDFAQELYTMGGKVVTQRSDTFCVMDDSETGKVAGAVEFAYYDPGKGVLSRGMQDESSRSDAMEKVKLDDIIGQCHAILNVKKKAARIVDLQSPILITGHTGTGKEMLARAIHNSGERSKEPFIYLNCSAIPENILEAMLFGIKPGSFTDAVEKDGLFKMADRGTLFLDEIDSAPLSVQGKILKAIEDKRIRPIGGTEEIFLDVRIIASCSRTLAELMSSNTLRQDLYFRLAVLQFELPPLRDRGDDIELIADHYLNVYAEGSGRPVKTLAPEVRDFFSRYSWPGNVRELKNTIEGTCRGLRKDVINMSDIRVRFSQSCSGPVDGKTAAAEWEDYQASGMPLKQYLKETEEGSIKEAMRQTSTMTEAASILGISPQLLRHKLEKMQKSEK